ncbi:kinase-like protein [Dipodascopsis tothii]|uniref:kinase-like protein n=1 Tax=Dipodascopsis tothii TaxID=44089 RepID=UPI0034CDC220
MTNLDSIPRPIPKSTTHKRAKNIVMIAGKAYQRLELLGKGGSSKVYKVQQVNSTRTYAMKKVTFDDVDEIVSTGFKGEIELLQKLRDEQRVVRLVDFEILDGCINLVMECGEIDLAHVLAARLSSPLDIEFVRYYTAEMLRCVAAVHDRGIVHSDLKPANFLLVQGMLKIIDFGIANVVPDYTANVRRETQIGTPNYMAPEALVDVSHMDQRMAPGVKCLKVGRPSDVWSCGCILYQMVYGSPPYAVYTGTHRMLAIMNPDVKIKYPDRGLGNMQVPREVVSTIEDCLQRDPAKRSTVYDVLNGPFVSPRYVTRDYLKGLFQRAVNYGAEKGAIGSRELDLLSDRFWDDLSPRR